MMAKLTREDVPMKILIMTLMDNWMNCIGKVVKVTEITMVMEGSAIVMVGIRVWTIVETVMATVATVTVTVATVMATVIDGGHMSVNSGIMRMRE